MHLFFPKVKNKNKTYVTYKCAQLLYYWHYIKYLVVLCWNTIGCEIIETMEGCSICIKSKK